MNRVSIKIVHLKYNWSLVDNILGGGIAFCNNLKFYSYMPAWQPKVHRPKVQKVKLRNGSFPVTAM